MVPAILSQSPEVSDQGDLLKSYLEINRNLRKKNEATLKELAKRWYPDLNRGRPHKQGTHRALDDIRESIEELRWYRERVFVRELAPRAGSAPDSVTTDTHTAATQIG